MINELSEKIHEVNVTNGFYESKKNIGEMIALIHSEVSEALEADRKDRFTGPESITSILDIDDDVDFKAQFNKSVKDSFEDELADAMIRIMDLAAYMQIDLESHIIAKVRFNSLRPYKHGKKY